MDPIQSLRTHPCGCRDDLVHSAESKRGVPRNISCITVYLRTKNKKFNLIYKTHERRRHSEKNVLIITILAMFSEMSFHLRQMGGKIQMFTTPCQIFTKIHPRFLKSILNDFIEWRLAEVFSVTAMHPKL